jgi:predicted amidohydrolase
MQDLTITLVQTDLLWEDIDGNLDRLDAAIDGIREPTDLIILPEMFSTGFSMNAMLLAEKMNGKAVSWLRNKATQKNVVIAGSVMVKEAGRFYNRLVWARPDGEPLIYDKKHLFRHAGEEKIYTAGSQQLTASLNGWKVRPFICYDLRFPIWTRNLNRAYDLAIFVASWPAARADHWRTLLKARAIENQAYMAAVNRVGTDGNGLSYSGHSALIDPTGQVLFEEENRPCTVTLSLCYRLLNDWRTQFPVLKDADGDLLSEGLAKNHSRTARP